MAPDEAEERVEISEKLATGSGGVRDAAETRKISTISSSKCNRQRP